MHKTWWMKFVEILTKWTCPVQLIRPQTHVLMGFAPFCHCKGGRCDWMHKTWRMKFVEILTKWTCPVQLIRRQTHVLMRFASFCHCKGGRCDWMHKTWRMKFVEILTKRTCPVQLIRPKTHVLMRFAPFCHCKSGRCELTPAVQQMHKTLRMNLVDILTKRTCPIQLIRPQTHVLMRHFATVKAAGAN